MKQNILLFFALAIGLLALPLSAEYCRSTEFDSFVKWLGFDSVVQTGVIDSNEVVHLANTLVCKLNISWPFYPAVVLAIGSSLLLLIQYTNLIKQTWLRWVVIIVSLLLIAFLLLQYVIVFEYS